MSMMVSPYAFGAAAVARNIAVIPMGTGASATTVSYTSSAISGLTPAGALIIGSLHQTANDPGETATASFCMGSIVGSTANAVGSRSRDAVTATDNSRTSSSAGPITISSATGNAASSTGGATVSGGFSVTYNVTPADRRCMGVAFAGAGTQAKNGVIALGTGTSAISVNTVGFQPDVVILYGHNDDFAAGTTQIFQYTFGFATSDGTQRCVLGLELDGQADGAPFLGILTDAGAGAASSAGGGSKMVIGGFSSSGFTVTPNASQSSDDLAYLALKFTGQRVKIVDFTTPTSTGSQAITGAGFMPQFALVVLTSLDSVTAAVSPSSDLQAGASISFIGDTQHSMSYRIDSGAATTDTATQLTNTALMGASATDCDAIIASLTSFDSDGMTLNYSAAQGTGKKGFILFIE